MIDVHLIPAFGSMDIEAVTVPGDRALALASQKRAG
jgi:hypothetical protein